MDCYATGMPLLAGLVHNIPDGPILEMGCGYYSTYILHEMCRVTKRTLITLDEKKEYLEKFQSVLENDFHSFHHVEDWASFSLIDELQWGIVLIDHAPGERRKEDIKRLKDKADFIVVHDTETASYRYEPILKTFKHRFDWKLVRPWTTVVSNKFNLDFLKD